MKISNKFNTVKPYISTYLCGFKIDDWQDLLSFIYIVIPNMGNKYP